MFKVFFALLLTFGQNSQFEPEKQRKSKWETLPHDICGRGGGYRIIGGSEVPMNAFPWIVRLGVISGNQVFFSCAGVLVSSDTVLTAAHCMPFDNMTRLGPIRLGEYNTKTNPDCELGFCSEPVIDVEPRMMLVPKDYNISLIHNDIAILKLKKNVTFTESVSPICVGSKKFYEQNFIGKKAEVAGWGYNNVESKNKSIKLEGIKIPILKQEVCKQKYDTRINVTDHQFCAGGEPGVDACNGDSGGPIMMVDNGPLGRRYYLLGIVSFGPIHCGNPEFPGIYTNFSAFLPWFLDNLDGSGREAYKVIL